MQGELCYSFLAHYTGGLSTLHDENCRLQAAGCIGTHFQTALLWSSGPVGLTVCETHSTILSQLPASNLSKWTGHILPRGKAENDGHMYGEMTFKKHFTAKCLKLTFCGEIYRQGDSFVMETSIDLPAKLLCGRPSVRPSRMFW